MRHEQIKVNRDDRTKITKTIQPWEIPIIEYIFGDWNVERTGNFVDVPGAEYPDPAEEMERLTKVYGSDSETKTPHAVIVFGAARKGVRELAKAIEAARDDEEGAKRAPKRGPSKAKRAAAQALLN